MSEEGGFEYKKSIINAILGIVRTVAESKETALTHLCEFIEDCEFTYLSTQILHLLGKEGPTTTDPSKYIRYIYNRIILENAAVRAAPIQTVRSTPTDPMCASGALRTRFTTNIWRLPATPHPPATG